MITKKVDQDRNLTECLHSNLERQLIAEYLLGKGYRPTDLRKLPKEERKVLMKEACLYAAVRLANIEAKSKFRRKIGAP